MEKRNGKALLPIFVFVVLYLGLGILFEYGLRIEMGFYKIPVVVIFLIALLVACLQNRALPLNDKLAVMGTGISDPNIITMILIFMLAGIFVGVVGRSSANSVAYFILSLIPPQFAVAVLFIVSCLVSLAMGTSVGTITLIVPIGIAVAKASGFSVPLCIASVMSGAMFGDNLSFISDTTIAACNGQGCKMTDKFKENFFIALPAAIVSVIIIFVLSVKSYNGGFVAEKYNLIQTIPYILVLIGGIVGLNVFLVLIIGVISGSVIMIATGMIAPTDLLGNMGTGAAGMFETSMVAILVAAICALIKEYGGFAALLHWIKQVFKGRRAVCSAWAYWSGLWISQPQIIPLPSLWQTPSQRKCPRTTASAAERLPPGCPLLPPWVASIMPMRTRVAVIFNCSISCFVISVFLQPGAAAPVLSTIILYTPCKRTQ